MDEILHQLGVDKTVFIQFGIFVVLFNLIPILFFKPFLKLIQERIQKTTKDKLKAESLFEQAKLKKDEYQNQLNSERLKARKAFDQVIQSAKQEENAVLGNARNEARKITQGTSENLAGQAMSLKKNLEADVEGLALQISETLLKRNS